MAAARLAFDQSIHKNPATTSFSTYIQSQQGKSGVLQRGMTYLCKNLYTRIIGQIKNFRCTILHILTTLVVAVLAGLAIDASAYTLPPGVTESMAQKTEATVLNNAWASRPQRVIVEFDTTRLSESQSARQAQRALKRPLTIEESRATEEILKQENQVDLLNLKLQVFPNRGLGQSLIVEDYRNFPLSVVEVRQLSDLIQILENDQVRKIQAIEQAYISGSQSLQLIGQPLAVSNGHTGGNTRIAVIDTGLAESRLAEYSVNGNYPSCRASYWDPSLGGDEWGTGNCRIQDAIDFTGTGYSRGNYYEILVEGSGTFLHAQAVSAAVARVAPTTRLSLLQVFTDMGRTDSNYILKALDWIMQNRNTSPRIVAVNMSFQLSPAGTSSEQPALYDRRCDTTVLATAMRSLISVGVIPVAASGNQGSLTSMNSPACITGVVSVGAVTDSTTAPGIRNGCSDGELPADAVPCFSNGGTLLTLLAPGVEIADGSGWATSGTSIAAPFVSGAIAILRSMYPNESNDQIVNRMVETGLPISRLGSTTVPRLQIGVASGDDTVKKLPTNPCTQHREWCS